MKLDIEQANKVLKKNPNCVTQVFGKGTTLTYSIEHMQSISSEINPQNNSNNNYDSRTIEYRVHKTNAGSRIGDR